MSHDIPNVLSQVSASARLAVHILGSHGLGHKSWRKNGRYFFSLTLNASIATKVVCFFRLLKCLRSLYGKQCGPRSHCSLFWVHAVCFYTYFVCNVRQLFAADDFSRRHFQIYFFLGALRVNSIPVSGGICRLVITFVNSLDPDPDRQNVSPDLDLNCLTHLMVFLKECL